MPDCLLKLIGIELDQIVKRIPNPLRLDPGQFVLFP